jgi:hypothetical protein
MLINFLFRLYAQAGAGGPEAAGGFPGQQPGGFPGSEPEGPSVEEVD